MTLVTYSSSRLTIEGCTGLQLIFSAVMIPIKLKALLLTNKKQVSVLLLYILIFFAFQTNGENQHSVKHINRAFAL